jgi:hypothetical protein
MNRRISVRMDMADKIKHAERTGGISRSLSEHLDAVDVEVWGDWQRARRAAKANKLAAIGAATTRDEE